MTGARVAVDTNIVIALLGGDHEIMRHFEESEQILLPFPVKGELLFGAMRSARPDENSKHLEKLFSQFTTISSSLEVERQYAKTKAKLMIKGRPIPENDIWVAACAQSVGIPISTRDSHFSEIDEITVLKW